MLFRYIPGSIKLSLQQTSGRRELPVARLFFSSKFDFFQNFSTFFRKSGKFCGSRSLIYSEGKNIAQIWAEEKSNQNKKLKSKGVKA